MHDDSEDNQKHPPPPTYEDTVSGSTSSLRVASAPESVAVNSNGDATAASSAGTVPASSPPLAAPASAPERSPSPPPGASRAVAPFKQSSTNGSFNGPYVVFLGESKSGPDVHITSTNGSITTALYLQGAPPGPPGRSAEVVTQTSNGRMALDVPARECPIDVRAIGANGKITLTLPRDYEGTISLRTTNGSKKLSPALMAHAVIVPSDGDAKTITYRIRSGDGRSGGSEAAAPSESSPRDLSSLTDTGFPKDKKQQDWMLGQTGPDRVHAETTNGSIRVYYYGEGAQSKTSSSECCEGKSSCVVM